MAKMSAQFIVYFTRHLFVTCFYMDTGMLHKVKPYLIFPIRFQVNGSESILLGGWVELECKPEKGFSRFRFENMRVNGCQLSGTTSCINVHNKFTKYEIYKKDYNKKQLKHKTCFMCFVAKSDH